MSDSRAYPIRIPVELNDELEHAVASLRTSKQATHRLALAIGLAHLRRIGYDLPRAVLDASALSPNLPAPSLLPSPATRRSPAAQSQPGNDRSG